MIITEKIMRQLDIRVESIDFLKNNNLLPLDLDKTKIVGDYGGYYRWFLDITNLELDNNGNVIYFKDKQGRFTQLKFDDQDNLIFKNFNDEIIQKFYYDENNKLIKKEITDLEEDSTLELEYDSNGNEIVYRKYMNKILEKSITREFIDSDKEFIIKENDKIITRIIK
jgi:YD repeat-containing protein